VFCSVVIPTIGRGTLTRAVQSVLEQGVDDDGIEVIVVNDSGNALPASDWLNHACVTTIVTEQRERCVARNAGAAVAKAEYLWFLDDDDWLLPRAIEFMRSLAADNPKAEWLYGGLRIVDDSGYYIDEINSGLAGHRFAQIMGGAWAPIQSSIIRTDAFFRAGGFDPGIIGTEDLDLCRRIARQGTIANTANTVACLSRGRSWSTSTDYERATADTRRSRDTVLDQPGALSSMLASADTDYWYGRMFHVYGSLVSHNLNNGRPIRALARGLDGTVAFARAGRRLFSRSFWQGVRDDHPPNTLHFVMQRQEAREPNCQLTKSSSPIDELR
jgi:glycosyltransferase involved in cell wall biosynthesis